VSELPGQEEVWEASRLEQRALQIGVDDAERGDLYVEAARLLVAAIDIGNPIVTPSRILLDLKLAASCYSAAAKRARWRREKNLAAELADKARNAREVAAAIRRTQGR
jgi:hypothetical protein